MRNHSNGNKGKKRWSAYLFLEEIETLDQELERITKVDKERDPTNATLLSRIVQYGLRLDKASIAQYLKTHTTTRRQTPART